MNKEAEWAKTAPYCELHRPTRRYTHSNRNIVLRILKSFRRFHVHTFYRKLSSPLIKFAYNKDNIYYCLERLCLVK
jgi:hypothetical protein